MVRGRAVMLCGAVVNFVFVCSRHREDTNFEWNDSKIPERSRTRSIPIRAETLPQSPGENTTALINTLMTGIGINPVIHDTEGSLRRSRWAARTLDAGAVTSLRILSARVRPSTKAVFSLKGQIFLTARKN
jgi:hypothetical protein